MLINKLFVLGGFVSFGLGALGVIVPLLPTTPFLLLSGYCFTRGSERFNVWLKQTRIYRSYVGDYLETRTISRKKKWKILLNIYILMGFSIFVVPLVQVKIMLTLLTLCQTIVLFFFIDEPKESKSIDEYES